MVEEEGDAAAAAVAAAIAAAGFDSNCITPGTDFMCILQKHLE